MSRPDPSTQLSGLFCGAGAFFLWGLFPLYWTLLQNVDAREVLCHRVVWSFFILLAIMIVTNRWRHLTAVLRSRRLLLAVLLNAVVISGNWLLYIWAVQSGYVLETSLGYFINPILSVLLGTMVLGERLSSLQWLAVALAAAGIANSVIGLGQFPWIALTLAASFALYGLIKKTVALDSLSSLTLETAFVAPVAVAYLAWRDASGAGALLNIDPRTDLLLIGAGVVTSVPLLLFGMAARRLPLASIGFLQYLAPTMQFLLAVLFFREPFTTSHLVTFLFTWAAVLVFMIASGSTWIRRRAGESREVAAVQASID